MENINPHELQRAVAALSVIKSMADKFSEEMLLSWEKELNELYGDPVQRFLNAQKEEEKEPIEKKIVKMGGCQTISSNENKILDYYEAQMEGLRFH